MTYAFHPRNKKASKADDVLPFRPLTKTISAQKVSLEFAIQASYKTSMRCFAKLSIEPDSPRSSFLLGNQS